MSGPTRQSQNVLPLARILEGYHQHFPQGNLETSRRRDQEEARDNPSPDGFYLYSPIANRGLDEPL